uniref:T-box domain-containing protein n=1 Tax=Panagrolaimus sp. ES5 TaxID=591445 RepID=A0AC34FIH1_9BILA
MNLLKNDNVFGSEQALLERFKIPNMEALNLENRGSEFRTKKFIIELLHLHWYHETNRIVVTESRVANGYKLANELIAQNDLKEQQFLQVSNRQKEKIVELQNQLEVNKTCAFGELDVGGPVFDERDESLRPHLGGGWHHPQISPLIDEPINERRCSKIDSETISNTGLNYDVLLNCSTISAACELEHPAAKIGRKHN